MSQACIYCGQVGPFNVEHAIPAGLGAGDAFVLEDLVCRTCNDFFSRELEVRVLRRGEIGLGRLALQPQGRSRGGKTRAPTFESSSAKLLTEDGRALENKLGSGLSPQILPQLTLDGVQLEGNGSDRRKVGEFLQRLGRVLGDRVELVVKDADSEKSLTFAQLAWSVDRYAASSGSTTGKPGKDTIWMELPQAETGGRARMLERDNGSLVIQVNGRDVGAAATLATLIRRNLSALTKSLSTLVRETDIPQPQIRVSGHSPTDDDLARFIAKIGFNLLALEQGRAFCCDPRFDALRSSIRTGNPELRMSPWTEAEGLLPRLHYLFAGKHWMMLSPMPNPATGARGLVRCCSLYGGAARIVLLTEDLPAQHFDFHVFYVVDYKRQSVARHTLFDVVQMMQQSPSINVAPDVDPR
ncbi:hypothetical protein [Mitsuaria sp. GD03876]|uniref:hypothetical protein n=1 Tax=Mitsuaria sp. GD03876 TaxID=2975399 RepID=UPI00244BF184|nr:hypothetical protein [Mitsuaria sp. GD03876]MDH0863669.1 HNH endonuclease [Mitsuaria sp. GD03876]